MNDDEFRTRRIGLVLGGGGAKGAYHIGCWKALRAHGLDRFDAIAGSSVGAINAVFVGMGRLDTAEAAWRSLRVRNVIGFSLARALRLPAWMLAGLGSEFSPFKITRLSDRASDRRTGWVHALVCAALAAALWTTRGLLPAPLASRGALIAALPLALAALALAHRFTRPTFLRPVFTSNAPLDRTLASVLVDADVHALTDARRPIYGVLSQHTPGTPGANRWGGWSPRYVRLDLAPDAASLRRTLVDGSAVPGFMDAGFAGGRRVLDGSWTDNVPVGPLLYGADHDLDVIIVVYLKQRARHTPRHNSLSGVIELLVRDAIKPLRSRADIHSWARSRWAAYCAAGPDAPSATPDPRRRQPLIVSVAPSRRVGNFFTGTLWFSRAKSAALIDLGERDMRAALARLADMGAASAVVPRARRRPRDTPAAVPAPAPASPAPCTAPALWPSPELEAAE
jgi:predicted acylesterase/phospholipase RssA